MKKYLIAFLALTVWFCLNQPTAAAYKKKSAPAPQALAAIPAPVVEAPLVAAPEAPVVPAVPVVEMAPVSESVPAEVPAVMPAVAAETVPAVAPEIPAAPVVAGPVMAKATIKGTAEGSTIEGTVTFNQTPEGVGIEAEINNVPNPGKHGFHVHEVGSCEDSGKAAGGHFNPDNAPHGDVTHQDHTMAHAGDMGNITVDETGKALYAGFLPGASLSEGKYNINGKAVILHEKEDDFGQPTGNAGGRIGCGIITVQ